MLGSTVLDVAVGLVFSFLGVSLVSSALVEAINSALKLRSKMLLDGVKRLLDDPDLKGLALQLYQHAAVTPASLVDVVPSSTGTIKTTIDRRLLPAYIEKGQFADALMDVVGFSKVLDDAASSGQDAFQALRDHLEASSGSLPPRLVTFLRGAVLRSQGDAAKIQQDISNWFDASMDRLSGAYKRWTQVSSFLVALAVAALINVDALTIGHEIWIHPEVVATLKLSGQVSPVIDARGDIPTSAADVLDVMDQHLPVGWTPGHPFEIDIPGRGPSPFWTIHRGTHAWWNSLLGWALTAAATLFGAPFWFDLLQTFVRLKGAGPSPAEKVSGRAASA